MPANVGAKPDWLFDGRTLTARIPMRFQRRGGRKVIVAPDGSEAWAPAPPKPDDTLIRALGRAHRWKRLLEGGTCASVAKIAQAEKIDSSYVSRILRLTLLAPNIVEAILNGRQPKRLDLSTLLRELPVAWEEQEERICTRARR